MLSSVWGTGDQPRQNPSMLFKCMVESFFNTTSHEIHQPVKLLIQKIVQTSLVRLRNDWHNYRSCRMLILGIAQTITSVYQAASFPTFLLSETHCFQL